MLAAVIIFSDDHSCVVSGLSSPPHHLLRPRPDFSFFSLQQFVAGNLISPISGLLIIVALLSPSCKTDHNSLPGSGESWEVAGVVVGGRYWGDCYWSEAPVTGVQHTSRLEPVRVGRDGNGVTWERGEKITERPDYTGAAPTLCGSVTTLQLSST